MKNRNVKPNCVRAIIITLSLALSLAGLLVPASALGPGFYMEEAGAYDPPLIHVKATKRKDRYDTVDAKSGSDGYLKFFSVKVRGQCPEKWRLDQGSINVFGREWDKYGNRMRPHRVDYWVDRSHRSIGPDHGQGWSEAFAFRVPYLDSDPGSSPIDRCNAELDRAANDSARKKLLAEGFNFVLNYRAELEIWCRDEHTPTFLTGPLEFSKSYKAHAYLPLRVRCMPVVFTKGPPPREGKHLDFDPPIKSVEVVADPAVTEGRKCPVYVNFRGRITAGEKSQYETFNTEYRAVGDHDFKSEWIFISVKRGETRTVNVSRFIQQADAPRGIKAPGGNLSSQDRQPSFKTDNPRGIKPPVKVPLFRGWMMFEVLLPDDTVRSAKAAFTVDCNPTPVGKRMKGNE